jgi:hypothetical protein
LHGADFGDCLAERAEAQGIDFRAVYPTAIIIWLNASTSNRVKKNDTAHVVATPINRYVMVQALDADR